MCLHHVAAVVLAIFVMLLLRLRGLVVVFVVLAWTHCHQNRCGGLAMLHVSLSSLHAGMDPLSLLSLSLCWRGPVVAVVMAWPCCTLHEH